MPAMSLFWILLASATTLNAEPVPATVQAPTFHPVGGAAARATASIRVISGVSFGQGRPGKAPGAAVRTTRLADAQGNLHPANLLEFQ